MSANLRPYWRLLRAGIHQQSTYRLAMLGGLVANATFGFLKAAVLLATTHAAGGQIAGYDRGSMSAYIWLSQGMLGSVNLDGRSAFADRVKSGDVAVDFARPINLQAAQCVTEIGESMWALVPRGLPSVLIGLFAMGMTMPASVQPYLLGVVSFLLAFAVSACCGYVVAAAGFWLVETRGVQLLYMVVSGFMAGLYVPITLMPQWLHAVALATPFPSMMQFPIDVLSGRVAGLGAWELVGAQLLWLVVTAGVGHALTVAGRRKLEIQGG